MSLNKKALVKLSLDEGALAPPEGAGYYVSKRLKELGLTPNKAAQKIGVSASTLTRLINGGSLTPELAARLQNAFNFDANTLFNLEAQVNAYRANQLSQSLEIA